MHAYAICVCLPAAPNIPPCLQILDPEAARAAAEELSRTRAEVASWTQKQKQLDQKQQRAGGRAGASDTGVSPSSLYPPIRHSGPAAAPAAAAAKAAPAAAAAAGRPSKAPDTKQGGDNGGKEAKMVRGYAGGWGG